MFAAAPPTANGCARRPVVHGAGTTVEYNGNVYGTLAGVAVDGADNTCQEEYLPLPSGPGRCVLAAAAVHGHAGHSGTALEHRAGSGADAARRFNAFARGETRDVCSFRQSA